MQVSDYTGLITSQHAPKPKFSALVAAIAQTFCDIGNFVAGMPSAFDLDTAVGAQLDVLGLWIGLSRNINVPVTGVYFTWDTAGLGWDQGVWWSPGDDPDAVSVMDDTTYRIMLRAKIGANHWDGSMEGSVAILNAIFNPEGWTAKITDNQDMTMVITITGPTLPALLSALITGGYIPIRPVGVSCTYVLP